ncbi:MAG TPA: sigma-70 family RNA polymerase sigma factor [Polyangiaceae bacterium]|nr:sigma-70 family RNA polymerase sigma factor [Polyangiaceae bacterium]
MAELYRGAGAACDAVNIRIHGAEPRPARLTRLVKEHEPAVRRVLSRLGLSAADVEDGSQVVFMIFARRIEAVAPGSEFPFLLGTARRVAASHRRTLHRRQENEQDLGIVDHALGDFISPEQLFERKRAREQLTRVLSRMSDARRSVFVLFTLEGFSLAEIASQLQLPYGTVASRLARARRDFETLAMREVI